MCLRHTLHAIDCVTFSTLHHTGLTIYVSYMAEVSGFAAAGEGETVEWRTVTNKHRCSFSFDKKYC